jgi:pimeloyl-[acyl-carrier protein] methyl ester esterase
MIELYQETTSGTDAGGLPLVLLHGWGMNLRVFDALVAPLATQRRVIRIDLPGHGRSPWAPSLAPFGAQLELLLATLPPRCDLLGWSLGGLFAMAIAARAPQRLGALVLVAATPRFEAAPDWPQGTATERVEKFADTVLADYQRGIRDFLELQVRGSSNAPATLALLREALFAHGEARPAALAADVAILRRGG